MSVAQGICGQGGRPEWDITLESDPKPWGKAGNGKSI